MCWEAFQRASGSATCASALVAYDGGAYGPILSHDARENSFERVRVGLQHEPVGARGAGSSFTVGGSRESDDADVVGCLEPPDEVAAFGVRARQPEVEHDGIGPDRLREPEARMSVACDRDLVAARLEEPGKRLQFFGAVVDDQDARTPEDNPFHHPNSARLERHRCAT